MVAVYGLVAFYLDEVPVYAEVPVELGGGDFYEFVLLETAGGALNNGERLGDEFVQFFLYCGVLILYKLVGLVGEFLLLFNGRRLNLFLYFCETLLKRGFALYEGSSQGCAACPQLVV